MSRRKAPVTSLDQVCDELLGNYEQRVRLEKTASIHRRVKLSSNVTMPDAFSLKKIASEIRHLAEPVNVTYEDIDNFIKESAL